MIHKGEFIYRTFFCLIEMSKSLELETLAKEFELDVKLNKNRTNHRQNDEIIEKSMDICSTRFKNKMNFGKHPVGFTKISYPKDQDIVYYTNPPDIVPLGCYCCYCDKRGPYAHENNCRNPKKVNLFLTIDGYMKYIYSEKYHVKGLYKEICTELNKTIREEPDNYLEIIKNSRISKKEDCSFDDETMISLSDFLILKKKEKEGKFFTGPVMITYTKDDKNITIRVRNKTIEIISNPWSNKDFYKELLERINNTSQKCVVLSGSIRAFFASTNILLNPDKYSLDLQKIFEYLWSDDVKIVINNEYYIEVGKLLFKYEVKQDKISKNRLYIDMIKCTRISSSEIRQSFFKISVQLFSQGHLQTTFGLIDKKDVQTNIPGKQFNCSLEIQFDIIKNLFNEVQDVFVYYLSSRVDIFSENAIRKISSKIFETIDGIMPYAKRKKFRKGDRVQLFNFKLNKWSIKEYMVVDAHDNMYEICDNNDNTRRFHYNYLRRVAFNNDQVCRLNNDDGIPKQPYPYSFNGSCPGGFNQFIHPIGNISRSDNKFYPSCSELTPESRKWVINWLLNGYSQEEMKTSLLNHRNSYDKFCGTFKPSTTMISNTVKIDYNGKWENALILDKHKTHGLGNDKNHVVYKMLIGDEIIHNIKGSSFHTSYIEDRFFPGLNNIEKSKDIIIECARRLHIFSDSVKLFKETLLSGNNFNEMIDSKVLYCMYIPEFLEDVSHKIVYIYKDGKISSKKRDVEVIDICLGYRSGKKFYPLMLKRGKTNLEKYFGDCGAIYKNIVKTISILMNKTFYPDYKCIIIFVTEDKKIYKWCRLHKYKLTLKNETLFSVVKDFPQTDSKYIQFIPNIMVNRFYNSKIPFINVKFLESGVETEKDLMYYILEKIQINTFLDSEWKIKNEYIVFDNKDSKLEYRYI